MEETPSAHVRPSLSLSVLDLFIYLFGFCLHSRSSSVMLDIFDANEALDAFAMLVLLKVLFMGPLTSYRRTTLKVRTRSLKCHCLTLSPSRCHQNDLENVLPFLGIGLMYMPSTTPTLSWPNCTSGSSCCHGLPTPWPSCILFLRHLEASPGYWV
uniref:Uncharacterized protein n=1 Tax=Eptatretus burgeri TaxID=7764 RepID=A0A8C4NDB8_EPTBU